MSTQANLFVRSQVFPKEMPQVFEKNDKLESWEEHLTLSIWHIWLWLNKLDKI